MKVLIIHHLQSMWENSYKKYGTSFEVLCMAFAEHLEENDYDKVILTQLENFEPEYMHYQYGLHFHVNLWVEYGYGWTWDDTYHIEKDSWCYGGIHSDVVMVDNWMKDLIGCEVYISGAFDGECIEDLEIALEHLEIDYNRIEELII